VRISTVTSADLPELLPLMRGYCDFYDVQPSDAELLTLAEALIADPEHEGTQLLVRDEQGPAVGFATIYWSWSTLSAARIGVMYDLFVDSAARRGGAGRALIEACADRCRERGIRTLTWTTSTDNATAQSLYDAVGGTGGEWIEYELEL
jgi:GNAT superfamily N-acetyltransferase